MAKKRTGEPDGVRVRSDAASDLERFSEVRQGGGDVESIPVGDAAVTAALDGGERTHHLVVGRSPIKQAVRGVEVESVDRRERGDISGHSGHLRM